jgi:rubrerythrin
VKIKNEELLEIIVKIEQEGQAFYKKLANHISDPMVKDYLLLMSKDEAQHENKIKNFLGEQEDRKYGWEDKPALREFVDAHLIQGLFPDLDEILKNLPEFEGIQKALNFALKAEEFAFEFYKILRQSCDDFETKTLMIEMESEEKAHCAYIQKLIEDLKKESS